MNKQDLELKNLEIRQEKINIHREIRKINRVYKKQYLDITGKKYNKLTAIRYTKTKNNRAWWLFKCDCGTIKEIDGKSVRTENTKSCGCQKINKGPKENLIGKKFKYLTVISLKGKNTRQSHVWNCKCKCGNTTEVTTALLNGGYVRSCGCLSREITIKLNKKRSGPNHPSYNHNISEKEREFRKNERKHTNPKLNRWRNFIYKRDNYTCLKCNKSIGGTLQAHHIFSWGTHPNLRYDQKNGATLCKTCHKLFHHIYGKKNTRKQFDEFLNKTI